MSKCRYPVELMDRFEFHSYGHALEILVESFPLHWHDICQALGKFQGTTEELNDIFKALKTDKGELLMKKYGASTTWMGKLLPRLNSRRNGGCPVLAVGIRKPCVVDWRAEK